MINVNQVEKYHYSKASSRWKMSEGESLSYITFVINKKKHKIIMDPKNKGWLSRRPDSHKARQTLEEIEREENSITTEFFCQYLRQSDTERRKHW
ncbi:hypothetical protein JTB14_033902 [Gonioctena quinquepunctata]|nr:hypothetical protein JTB14_033902 [Gonioctena quinquepunctata]